MGGLTTLIPGAAAAATAAGALSLGDEKDQDPASGVGLTPAGVLTAAAADDDDKGDDAVDVLTTPDTTPNTTPDTTPDTTTVVGASTVDELPPVPRTGLPGAETPAITRTGLPSAEKPAVARTALPDSEIEKILADLGGLPAVAGGYDTPEPEIKTAAEPTASSSSSPAGGGGGGGGSTQTGGTRTVTVEPGPLVDIPGLYDISSDSIIPEYLGELIRRSQRQRAAEGGQVKRFTTGGATDAEKLASVTMGQATGFGPVGSSSGNTGVRGKLGQCDI